MLYTKEKTMFEWMVHNAMVEGVILAMDVIAENGALRGQDKFKKALFSDHPVIREAMEKKFKVEIKI